MYMRKKKQTTICVRNYLAIETVESHSSGSDSLHNCENFCNINLDTKYQNRYIHLHKAFIDDHTSKVKKITE